MPADAAASSPSVIDLQRRIDELSSTLRECESRLGLVTDAVAEGIYEWNIETNALWQSQRLVKIFGLEGRELKAADWNELVHPEDFERYRSALRDCFKGIAERLDCEYRVKHTDGSHRWLEDRAVPVRNAAGLAIRLVGAVTDVTGRKESEYALREALEQQTATAEVLQVINSSPGDLAPVFDAMLEKATRLCEAKFGNLLLYDGQSFTTVADRNLPPAYAQAIGDGPIQPGPSTALGRMLGSRAPVHVTDMLEGVAYAEREPLRMSTVELGGVRSMVAIPLLREGDLVGAFTIYRREAGGFTDNQIALVSAFADQAVIAIENTRLLKEQREALEQQTAASNVLQVISRSPGDPRPVFDEILANATRICGAQFGTLGLRDEAGFRFETMLNLPPQFAVWLRANVPLPIIPGSAHERVVTTREFVHIADLESDTGAASRSEQRRALIDLAGAKSMLWVPMVKDDLVVGMISIYRIAVEPFTDQQIELVKNFANQAAIAVENARLLSKLTRREAELSVTFEHMGDGVAMFDADRQLAAWNSNFEEIIGLPRERLAERPSYADYLRLLAERGEFGTENVEAELANRLENTDRELRLERTRADGSVIEVRRNAVPGGGFVLIYSDVTEERRAEAAIRAARDDAEAALERQTATADILKVIASSPTDVQPVLDAVVKAAVRFCGARDALISLREDDEMIWAAHEGPLTPVLGRGPLDRNTISGRTVVDSRTIHIPDMGALGRDEMVDSQAMAAAAGTRAALAAPMLREGVAVGCILLGKREPGAFTPQQIELLETFAAQAVIAIENVRLFTELRNSLEQQTATAEILRAISQSPTDVTPVLDAVAKAAVRFCGAEDASIFLKDGVEVVFAAHEGSIGSQERGRRDPLDGATIRGQAIIDGRTIHMPDAAGSEGAAYWQTQELARQMGFHAVLAAPMLREEEAIGSIALRKSQPIAFAPRQIELLETFAAQAVIAIENVRLFTELRDSLERLKAAQANLIQAEKMASLGQLTAGIAHEIKNPLNFVNNFAGLSVELLDELKQAATPVLAGMSEDARADFGETVDLITSNLEKIAEHGKRADGIVRSMLAHSRGGTGDWQASNINALVEEALNLAYHGARAQDKDFNVTLERDFAETTPIEVVPQDVTRVFLNLFGNAFYAAKKRQLSSAGSDYRPTLTVCTRDLGEAVEIKVRDNGTGMPAAVRQKLFQPFFTTKPTGEGTGLGLSISYDIVTQQHGGTIEVESEPGQYTEFTVRLPRRRRTV